MASGPDISVGPHFKWLTKSIGIRRWFSIYRMYVWANVSSRHFHFVWISFQFVCLWMPPDWMKRTANSHHLNLANKSKHLQTSLLQSNRRVFHFNACPISSMSCNAFLFVSVEMSSVRRMVGERLLKDLIQRSEHTEFVILYTLRFRCRHRRRKVILIGLHRIFIQIMQDAKPKEALPRKCLGAKWFLNN